MGEDGVDGNNGIEINQGNSTAGYIDFSTNAYVMILTEEYCMNILEIICDFGLIII